MPDYRHDVKQYVHLFLSILEMHFGKPVVNLN